MNSFEFNKIAAALLIALITLKGADLISEELIRPKMLKQNVFKIEGIDVTPHPIAEEKKGPAPIEPLLASADPKKGQAVFKKCQACHSIEKGGPNLIGPDLYAVIDRPRGENAGYSYSSALEKEKGKPWTYEALNHFLFSPRQYIPGTKMTFAGIKDDQERANVIAYLREQTPHAPPVPKAEEKPAPENKTEEKPAPSAEKKEQPAPPTVPSTE